jgi:hypothetical protein
MPGPDAQLADLIDDFVLSSMQAIATNEISICQWRTLTAKKPRASTKKRPAYDSGTQGFFFQKFKNYSNPKANSFGRPSCAYILCRASLIRSCVVFRGTNDESNFPVSAHLQDDC